jgi:hypothetical protein
LPKQKDGVLRVKSSTKLTKKICNTTKFITGLEEGKSFIQTNYTKHKGSLGQCGDVGDHIICTNPRRFSIIVVSSGA